MSLSSININLLPCEKLPPSSIVSPCQASERLDQRDLYLLLLIRLSQKQWRHGKGFSYGFKSILSRSGRRIIVSLMKIVWMSETFGKMSQI